MSTSGQFSFTVAPVAPCRLDLTAWALRRRPRNIVDRWDGTAWRRVLMVADRPIDVCVRQQRAGRRPLLRVTATGGEATRETKQEVRRLIERCLGLRIDLGRFYALARRDVKLNALAREFRGLKPPRFPTVFEALVNAIACQQLSLIVGLELLGRLAAACAASLDAGAERHYAFPRPRDLLRLPAATYHDMGFSRQKTRALVELGTAADAGDIDLESLEKEANEAAIERLLAIRGVGRWSAEYVLLRGLGRLDVFPGDDVGARKTLGAWLGRRQPLDYASVEKAVAAWRPYAGLVYFHMLLRGLRQKETV